MMLTGRCHCGAIQYSIDGEPVVHALCHCADCRRNAGAPMVGWLMLPEGALTVNQGEPKDYRSSEYGRRRFCGDCGTGLFFTNEQMLPGLVDVQSSTLDNPQAIPAQVHIQLAERIDWMETAHALPGYDRYPTQ